MNMLNRPVAALTGIGPQTAKRLQKIGIHTIQDLLFHLPYRYEDHTRLTAIGRLEAGTAAFVAGTVEYTDILNNKRRDLISRISDGTGFISIKFFHYTATHYNNLKAGTLISCYGEVRYGFTGLEMVHPDYKVIDNPDEPVTESCLTPVYPLTEGLTQAVIRKAVKQALNLCLHNTRLLTDWLPESILRDYHFPSLTETLQQLHAPEEPIASNSLKLDACPALRRLAFEELLTHHLCLKKLKQQSETWSAPEFAAESTFVGQFLRSLPFKLTAAQQRVISEINADCQRRHPMMRLVQGDVGSGKTVVSAYGALLAIGSGYQAAVMAPTELLAEQHFCNFTEWFSCFQANVVLLTGQSKGRQRTKILESVADGSANIVIGTHALFQENIEFHRLGLCIIDEQHRFGVHQRLALREKGKEAGIKPHQLIMTATPIPRTLAMLEYSDLDISIIDELPPGRKPVITSVIPAERRNEVIAKISSWAADGKQTYWVCTLIEESDVLQCEAAEKTAERLSEALPDIRVGLIHGRMKAVDKEATMQAFKNHHIDLLVATTVIEVGVDVPNAGLMIIENPERLGLSQLHQLRGRIGRGSSDSYCLLLYQSPLSETARQRLGILRDTNDGFVIAEKDLHLRGPGEVLGTRQTGSVQFKIADLSRDADLLDNIAEYGDRIIRESPESLQPLCDRWLNTPTEYAEV